MTNVRQEFTRENIKTLLDSYSFDTNQCSIEFLLDDWLENYKLEWIYLATIEALYLGRYKVVSIKQILTIWERLGTPKTHFGGDFERFIGRDLPKHDPANQINEPELSTTSSDCLEKIEEQEPLHQNFDSEETVTDEVTSSEQSLLSQMIQDNFPATKISQPKAHSDPQTKEELGFIPPTSIFNKYKEDLGDNYLSPHTGIKSFSPVPDFSEFFQKLKSFADNQNQSK